MNFNIDYDLDDDDDEIANELEDLKTNKYKQATLIICGVFLLIIAIMVIVAYRKKYNTSAVFFY